MTQVTFATLEESLPKFIEEVLTNNITDPIEGDRPGRERFIYKDAPPKLADYYPYIIVEVRDMNDVIPDEKGDIVYSGGFQLLVTVLAKKTSLRNNPKYDRDYYTSQVKSVLRNLSNTNSDGYSISSQFITWNSMRTRPRDAYTGDAERVFIKELVIDGNYEGE